MLTDSYPLYRAKVANSGIELQLATRVNRLNTQFYRKVATILLSKSHQGTSFVEHL